MDSNTLLYYRSALKLKLPAVECSAINGMIITLGKRNYFFYDYATPWNNSSSIYISLNKYISNSLMREAGIPIPKSTTLAASEFSYDELLSATSELKFPLVLKPFLWSAKGRDVICNIPTMAKLYTICEQMLKLYPFLMLEEYHGDLQDYRVLVFKNQILAVVARYPAFVIGNGRDTIKKLVEDKNELRAKTSDVLKPIVLGYEANFCLENQNLTLQSIPEKDQRVQMGYTCNASVGGESESIPLTMCDENKKLFLKAASVLSLTLVGFDIACKNLAIPLGKDNGIFIEANKSPSMRIHEEEISGPPQYVSMNILRALIYKHPISYSFHLLKLYKYRVSIFAALLIGIFLASHLLHSMDITSPIDYLLKVIAEGL